MKLQLKFLIFSSLFLALGSFAWAQEDTQKVTDNSRSIAIQLPADNKSSTITLTTQPSAQSGFDPLKYTLGPEDAVEISVMRHPEFSGVYPINKEGKLQYKFVGDIDVIGLTKLQLEQKIKEALSTYLISPDVNVTVTEYRSKVIYILGEVGTPGKYYMQSEAIPVREAVFQAGLPTASAAMRKCRLISPKVNGNAIVKPVDLYAVLYCGNLRKNINMHPGDVLYVPSTIMAKVIKVINPVATTVGLASSGPSNAGTAKTGVQQVAGKPVAY